VHASNTRPSHLQSDSLTCGLMIYHIHKNVDDHLLFSSQG
jgi:hypothetical protein